MSEETTPRVVQAVASMSAHGGWRQNGRTMAKLLEEAETQAVQDCLSEGISVHDAEQILARKREYRARLKDAIAQLDVPKSEE